MAPEKDPKSFGRISGYIILFVSSKLSSYFDFYSLYNISKDQLYRISGSEFYEWLFEPEKFSGPFGNGPQACVARSTVSANQR